MISIIIPYCNKKNYIEQTIASILDQTFKDFEILIIYDDEKKRDLNFLENLIKIDNRIKLIINEKNLGAGESRNKGIKLSSGEFIAFIDSDDLWEKNKLEIQYNYLIQNKLKICHTEYKIIDKDNKEIGYRKSKKKLTFEDLLKSCDIGLSTVLLKKELINDEVCFANTKTKEDYILWLKVAKLGIEIEIINQSLSKWRKLNNSLSSSVSQKLYDGFLVYYKYMSFNVIKSIFYLIRLSIYSIQR
tara:strand:+ start:188 stop:922 length:735 start_codon:yes stop_codon:yes gene_type:complete